MSRKFGSTAEIDTLKSQIEYLIKSKSIFVLSKVKCSACVKAKALLNKLSFKTGVKPSILDLDNYPKQFVRVIISWLSATKTGIKTVPQIFIKGKFVGGNDDVQKLHTKGRLLSLIGMKIGTDYITGPRSKEAVWPRARLFSCLSGRDSHNPRTVDCSNEVWNFNSNRSSGSSSGSPMSYRSAGFMMDDERKWDMLPQFSQSSRSITNNLPPLQRSKSLEVVGVDRSSPGIGGSGNHWHRSSLRSSVSSRTFVDYGQKAVSLDNGVSGNWVAVQPSVGSSGRSPLKRIVISRFL